MLGKLLAEGQFEADANEQLAVVDQLYKVEAKKCAKQREEVERDVKTYRAELEELQQLAKVGSRDLSDLTATSLLGESAIRSARRVATGGSQRRGMELHVGVARAAKRVALCQVGGPGPTASPAQCKEDQKRLEKVFQEAYKHILDLLRKSEDLAADDTCLKDAESVREEQGAPFKAKQQRSREKLCSASRDGDKADAKARQMVEDLQVAKDLLGDGCAGEPWRAYEATVRRLAELVDTRPRCPKCCAGTGPGAGAALAGSGQTRGGPTRG